MPNPMKVKVFMDTKASIIEEQINEWLDDISSVAIIKTDTVVTALAEKPTMGPISVS
jgi:hypothetical protein